MSKETFKHIYGPVPSRRLGRSLGLDMMPCKTCTYNCIYCQLGQTTLLTTERKEYIPVSEILKELEQKLNQGEQPDYISIAGSGEPTLNSGIGELIPEIKKMTDIPLTVITNGSLLWLEDVRKSLMKADIVIPSLDAGNEITFRSINKPHKDITFDRLIGGLIEFTEIFRGQVWLEVMLLKDAAGITGDIKKIVDIAKHINPAKIQLNTVSRPPAESSVLPLSDKEMNECRNFFPVIAENINKHCKSNSLKTTSQKTGETEVISLVERRPCTVTDIAKGLGIHITETGKLLEKLIEQKKIKITSIDGNNYFSIRE